MGGGISNSSEQSQSEVVWSNLLDLHSGKLSPIERLIPGNGERKLRATETPERLLSAPQPRARPVKHGGSRLGWGHQGQC